MIKCPSCKNEIAADLFLGNCSSYNATVNTVKFKCPECEAKIDSRIESSKISLGYVYAAGAPHYAAMIDYKVPSLHVKSLSDLIEVSFNGDSWLIKNGE